MILSPIQIVVLAALLVGLAFGTSMLVYSRLRSRSAFAYFFDRQRNALALRGNSYSGLVSHEDGGYVEREDAVLDMYHGRPMAGGDDDWKRSRRAVFIVRARDSSPLKFDADGQVSVNNLSDVEYEERMDLAADLAVKDAAKKAAKGDLLTLMFGVVVVIEALALAGIVAAVAAKGAF